MANWSTYAQETLSIENRFVKKIRKVLYSHYKLFADNLRRNGHQAALAALSLHPWNEQLLPLLTDIYRTAGLAGARRAYDELNADLNRKGLFLYGYSEKFTGLGRNEQWIRDVLDYIGLNLLNKAVLPISETTRNHILQVMEVAVTEGWSIQQIVEEIMSPELLRARARTIARTEVHRASNVGHVIGARSMPFEVTKKWQSARDHRTRHSHRLMNGKKVDEDEAFEVPVFKGKVRIGTEKMQHPCDSNGSAGNVINCRCRVIFVAKRDEQGNPIPRKTTPPTAAATTTQSSPRTPSPAITVITEALHGFSLGQLLAEALND